MIIQNSTIKAAWTVSTRCNKSSLLCPNQMFNNKFSYFISSNSIRLEDLSSTFPSELLWISLTSFIENLIESVLARSVVYIKSSQVAFVETNYNTKQMVLVFDLNY